MPRLSRLPALCGIPRPKRLAPAKEQVNSANDCHISCATSRLWRGFAGQLSAAWAIKVFTKGDLKADALQKRQRKKPRFPARFPNRAFRPESLDTREFAHNMLSVGVKSQKLVMDFITRMSNRENPGPIDPLNISGALLALAKAMGSDREAVIEAQTQWWNNFMTLWEHTARRMLGGDAPAVVEPAPGDRRFRSDEWRQNEIFDFIKQSYLLTANAMQEMVGKLNGLDEKERGRVALALYPPVRRCPGPHQFSPHQSGCAEGHHRLQWRESGQRLGQSVGRYRTRPWRAFHSPIRRRVYHRREYRHRARQSGVPQRNHGIAAIFSDHR